MNFRVKSLMIYYYIKHEMRFHGITNGMFIALVKRHRTVNEGWWEKTGPYRQ